MRGTDLRSLPLTPTEGFVLSRVDGAANVGDIADLTGLGIEVVLATLDKLVKLDAVEWADGSTGLPRASQRPPAMPSARPPGAAPPAAAPLPPAAPLPSFDEEPTTRGAQIPMPPRAPSLDMPLPDMPLPDMGPPDPTVPEATAPGMTVPDTTVPDMTVAGPTPAKPLVPPPVAATASPSPRPPPERPSVPLPPRQHNLTGVHVYSARHESEPPIVETFEAHKDPHRKSNPAGSSPPTRRSSQPARSSPPASPSSPVRRSVVPPSLSSPSPAPASPTPTRASPAPASPAPASPTRASPAPAPSAAALAPPPPPKADADEPIDLPEDRRKKIDELYVVVDLLDHYQILGIERTAERAKVKSSYFELSKQFHPDTAFRKNVGPYRQKMEVIFRRLTEAYDVLSKKKAREEYDAYLARSEKSHEYEQTLSGQHDFEKAIAAIEAEEARQRAAEEARQRAAAEKAGAAELEKAQRERALDQQRDVERRRHEEEARLKQEGMGSAGTPAVFSPRMGSSPGTRPSNPGFAAVRPPAQGSAPARPVSSPGARPLTSPGTTSSPGSTTSPGTTTSPGSSNTPLMTEEAKRRAKELLTRRLDASRATGPLPERTTTTTPPAPAPSKGEVIRDLAASLKGAAQLTGGLDPAQRHALDARRSLAEGNLAEAVKKLRLATAMAPDNRELRTEHDRLAQQLAASLADNYAEQAEYEERHQKWAAAAVSWQKVVDGRPDEARCHWRCAKALLESSGDTKAAVRLAQRGVDLEPNNVFAVRVLGRAFMTAGMSLNAKRELERAVSLDPSDEATKGLLKELKGG